MNAVASLFGEDDRKKIASAVFDAESKTAAEIVPIVAASSGRYDRAEDIVGLIAGLGAMIVAWLLFQHVPEDPSAGGWDGLPLSMPLWGLVLLLIAGFAGGAALAARFPRLRRPFVPAAQMTEEVADRAAQLFFDKRVRHTTTATGVLVYLSLFERRAVILADDKAFEALGQDVLDQQCKRLSADVRRGDLTAAICAAIGRLGDLLSRKLPRGDDDRNELADALVTIG